MKGFKLGMFGVILLFGLGVIRGDETPQWSQRYKSSYQDVATGRAVSFGIRTPPKPKDPTEKLRLVVVLKNGIKVAPSAEFPFIEVRPSVGGIWGYRAMSAVDVMSVIRFMKQHYPIDPDRIYLVGYSAGASGAMHLASLYPDQFAAVLPLVAMGNDYPLLNFTNLPVAVHHGDKDWTSSICSARVQIQKMQKMEGLTAVLHKYPGVGHSVPLPHEPIMKWLLSQKRNPLPDLVSIDCETPERGRIRYLQIQEFSDPHQRATVTSIRISQYVEVTTILNVTNGKNLSA